MDLVGDTTMSILTKSILRQILDIDHNPTSSRSVRFEELQDCTVLDLREVFQLVEDVFGAGVGLTGFRLDFKIIFFFYNDHNPIITASSSHEHHHLNIIIFI